jgi:hypothetical protein
MRLHRGPFAALYGTFPAKAVGFDPDPEPGGESDAPDLLGEPEGDEPDDEAPTSDVDALVAVLVPALEKQFAERFDAIADKRINGLGLRKQRTAAPARQPTTSQASADAARERLDSTLREARLTYREYVGDEIKFGSSTERSFAADLANGLLYQRISEGDSAEEAGREVAQDVAKRVKQLREGYQTQMLANLKTRGVLNEDALKRQTAGRQAPAPPDQNQYNRGVATAARILEQQGRTPVSALKTEQ